LIPPARVALSLPAALRIWVAVWAGQLAGLLPPPGAGAMGLALLWHAHEMVFGFAAAIVVGFLFTAGRAWTGVDTPAGPALAALRSEGHTSELQSRENPVCR